MADPGERFPQQFAQGILQIYSQMQQKKAELREMQNDRFFRTQMEQQRNDLLARGQDLEAERAAQTDETNRRGQDFNAMQAQDAQMLQLRGQNMTADAAARNDMIQTRGQDINQQIAIRSATSATRGQDMAAESAKLDREAAMLRLQATADAGKAEHAATLKLEYEKLTDARAQADTASVQNFLNGKAAFVPIGGQPPPAPTYKDAEGKEVPQFDVFQYPDPKGRGTFYVPYNKKTDEYGFAELAHKQEEAKLKVISERAGIETQLAGAELHRAQIEKIQQTPPDIDQIKTYESLYTSLNKQLSDARQFLLSMPDKTEPNIERAVLKRLGGGDYEKGLQVMKLRDEAGTYLEASLRVSHLKQLNDPVTALKTNYQQEQASQRAFIFDYKAMARARETGDRYLESQVLARNGGLTIQKEPVWATPGEGETGAFEVSAADPIARPAVRTMFVQPNGRPNGVYEYRFEDGTVRTVDRGANTASPSARAPSQAPSQAAAAYTSANYPPQLANTGFTVEQYNLLSSAEQNLLQNGAARLQSGTPLAPHEKAQLVEQVRELLLRRNPLQK